MTASRDDWDSYFARLAEAASLRGTCDRKRVGAVFVRDNRIVATGYNGALPGEPHCDDAGHDLVTTLVPGGGAGSPNCVRTVHAEANALASAARFGVALDGFTAYVNTYPCWPCFRLMASAGLKRLVYTDAYRLDGRVESTAARLDIPILHLVTVPDTEGTTR